MNRVLPNRLLPGDTVGIIAPASNISRDALAEGCAGLERFGLKSAYSPEIFDQVQYFAGPAEARIRDVHAMFTRRDIKAVLCARGGYGSNYLLPLLDLELLARNPKPLIGYSDATSLLTVIHDRTGLVTFHGPMVTKDFARADGVDPVSWGAALGGQERWEIPAKGASVLVAGEAEGILYGGCLSMLVASLGTPYEIQTEGKLLFIEDVATKPYQIDRMLMQLKFAGKLKGAVGLVFGEMLDCVQHAQQGYSLEEVVARIVGDLHIPAVYGIRSGHVSRENITIPIGVRARLQAGAEVRITVLEASTH